jgi:hypothetical protein
MNTKPDVPKPEGAGIGPNSLNSEIFVVSEGVGVIDATVRPLPEHFRKEIEKNRPWLLKPQPEPGQSDHTPKGRDDANQPPKGQGQ